MTSALAAAALALVGMSVSARASGLVETPAAGGAIVSSLPATPGLSTESRAVLQAVRASGDSGGKPFAIVDKKRAHLWVFDGRGVLLGETAALLGAAVGDDSAPGVGARAATVIPSHEQTTPAGRFESQPGHNHKGEAIVWVDYGAAVAIHRLRPAAARERRPERLASASPADNRISLGCVVVSAAFYDRVVAPTLGRMPGVVYILPEVKPLHDALGMLVAAAP